jgi:hypothetical protein
MTFQAVQAVLRSKDMVMAFMVIMIYRAAAGAPAFLYGGRADRGQHRHFDRHPAAVHVHPPADGVLLLPDRAAADDPAAMGINISVSRLILLDGQAGSIVSSFGNLCWAAIISSVWWSSSS